MKRRYTDEIPDGIDEKGARLVMLKAPYVLAWIYTAMFAMLFLPFLFIAPMVCVLTYLIVPTVLIAIPFMYIPSRYRRTARIFLSEDMLIIATGILQKKSFKIRYDKITAVKVESSWIERRMGYATIRVFGHGVLMTDGIFHGLKNRDADVISTILMERSTSFRQRGKVVEPLGREHVKLEILNELVRIRNMVETAREVVD